MSINKYIDHTNLKPTATEKDITALCKEAVKHQFAAVCISPYYLELAKKIIGAENINVCTVIGFPFGFEHLATKLDGVLRAIQSGADEIDVVVNLAAVKNHKWDIVENEIDSLATTIKLKNGKIFKLILETAYLTREELKLLCNLCSKYNVDFAKTSTGYAPKGADVKDVEDMKKWLDDKVAIKASGGIKTKTLAKALIKAGATRLGTSSGVNLI